MTQPTPPTPPTPDGSPTPLQLATTTELFRELAARHDASIFAAVAYLEQDPEGVTTRSLVRMSSGQHHTCIGLATDLGHMLSLDVDEACTDEDPDDDSPDGESYATDDEEDDTHHG